METEQMKVFVVKPAATADVIRLVETTEGSLGEIWAAGRALAEWMSQNASGSFMDGFFEAYEERHPGRFAR